MKLLTSLFIVLALTSYGQKVKRSDWKVIPANLDESLTRLDLLTDDKFKKEFQALAEKDAVKQVNFIGPGTALRNNWKLWHSSVLSRYFNGMGIHDPELMTRMIFTSYHRKLNNKELDIEQQVALFTDIENFPEKYEKLPLDRLVAGDTIVSQFYELGSQKINTERQCNVTAVIKEIDYDAHQAKIEFINISPTRTDLKYDKEKYRVGNELWENASGLSWRKKGDLIEIHIGG